jgi:nicotinamidase-related amidase
MNHPTLRKLSGATPVAALDAAATALLVIDFQDEYFSGALPIPGGMDALRNARCLVRFADDHNMPVFHIQHVAPGDSPLFAARGQSVRIHAELQPADAHTVLQKTTVSAFASTDLDARLKAAGIGTVLVCGLMTHACVAGAARDAVPLGYTVIVASDASATRDIEGIDGSEVSHESLHRAALISIEDTFGDVMTTDRIIGLPLQ